MGQGLNAGEMLKGQLKAVVLLNNEPEFDSAMGLAASHALNASQMIVTMSPFKTNMNFSDVLLPIAPFSETSGTFVNAEGRFQSFHAVVKPLAETRPAWKVLRVLGNLMALPGFDFESSQDVLVQSAGDAPTFVGHDRLDNTTDAPVRLLQANVEHSPVVASIYQTDSLVRRATSLQLTTDAKAAGPNHVSTRSTVMEASHG